MSLENLRKPLDLAKQKPMTNIIYEHLLKNIVNGNMEEGERLVEQSIAKLFGVSRQPVNEALRWLKIEEFVEFIPYKGFIVSRITTKDVFEVLEFRGVLEGYAAWKCAKSPDRDLIKELGTILNKMELHINQKSYQDILIDNYEFHHRIMENINNEKMFKYYEKILNSLKRYYAIGLATLSGPHTSLDEHKKIFEKIHSGDPMAAQECARQHTFNTMDRVTTALKKTS
jgi:DNA-binding GntR family transcriptional regulator